MKPTSKTLGLLLVALVLLALNLLDRGTGERLSDQLPRLAAAPTDLVTRIELSDAVNKVVLEPRGEGEARAWRLVAPVDAPADARMIDALLGVFDQEVPVDVQVDEGNLDAYGLDAGNGVVVELWTGSELPSTSFTVGNDAPGGSSFVRLSGNDAIYRARVGGKARYSVKPSEWRNRVPLDFERTELVQLESRRSDGEGWLAVRGASPGLDEQGAPLPGTWTLDPAPAWSVDADALEAIAFRAGAMRAEEVLGAEFAGGFDPPLAVSSFTLSDGTTKVLEVGSRGHPEAAFVRLQGEPEVYRVPKLPVLGLLIPRDDLRDKRLMGFESAEVDTLALDEGGRTWLLRQSGAGRWEVVEPPNVDVDVGRVAVAVDTLSQLRGDAVVEGLDAAAAGLQRPEAVVSVFMVDGTSYELELGATTTGPDGSPARYVRARGSSVIMRMPEQRVQRIKQAFGRI